MKNKYQYIKSEDLEWYWSFDQKTKSHKLKLTHIPTLKSVDGFIFEKNQVNLATRKRELQDILTEKLEKLVFGEEK